MQPSSYPINTIFLWTGGSHEGVLQVSLRPGANLRLEPFQESLRQRFQQKFPTATFSFEPGDIVSRIMNFGAQTPVEVAVMGPDFAATRAFATKVRDELAKVPSLRDLQYGQALDYPAIQVNVNRQMAGQLGVTVDDVVEVIEQEADEDAKLLAGVGDERLSDSVRQIAPPRFS